MGLACLVAVGCGGPAAKVVHGSVTHNGEKVAVGRVTFVPLKDDAGPNCEARIVDGQYRFAARGGVPLGNYRVCVDARKKTGRKLAGPVGSDMSRDEEVRIGPEAYAGEQSPLTLEVRADFEGTFDITIPRIEDL